MQERRILCGLLSSTLTWTGCNITPPSTNPEFARTESRLSDELTDARVTLDQAEQEVGKQQREETVLKAEIEQIVGEAQAARYAHKDAVSARAKYVAQVEKGLQLGELCRRDADASVEVDDVVKIREYLLQFVSNEQRDTALRSLDACRKLFSRRLKVEYVRDAAENREEFAYALEDAFDEANRWSRGNFHARVQGKQLNVSMRGNFEGRARHSREQVETWCSFTTAYVFERITLRNAHGTFSCKPNLRMDDIVGVALIELGLADDAESAPSGAEPVPPEPGPAPTPNEETSSRRARLAQIELSRQAAVDLQASARFRVLELDRELSSLHGAEARRLAAWRKTHETRARKEKLAGGLSLGIGGVVLSVTALLFYARFSKHQELEAQKEKAEASARALEFAGIPTDSLDATIEKLRQDIRREEKRQWTTAIVGISIGVPMLVVGTILRFTGKRRQQQARQFSLDTGSVLIRF